MTLTIFGVVVLLIGIVLLLRGSVIAMLAFVMGATLFGGSGALALPALGGSTIPPASLALIFLMLRILVPMPGQGAALRGAWGDNLFLVVFCLYGSVTAWLLPRIFSAAVNLTPLHPGAVRQLYESAPLHFSSQNITTSVYLLGTLAAGLGAHVGATRAGSTAPLLKTGIAIAIAHALFGFLSIAVAGTPFNAVIELFRNGHYAQLDQSIAGLSRMTGLWPEASGFAAYGGAWLIFTTELWLRDIRTRSAGLAAALLALALLLSTSSTAYVTLAAYATVLGIRAALIPTSISSHKLLVLTALGLTSVIIALAMMLLVPEILESFTKILRVMTVDKTDSFSGRQRLFWALQGWDAFAASGGLGVGAGSFRSSSLVTSILGSMGVIGALSFAAQVLRAFSPLRRSTWFASRDERQAVSAAAGWTALLMLVPAAISSPSPDPGIIWAMFAGLALGMSRAADARQRPRTPRPCGVVVTQEALI